MIHISSVTSELAALLVQNDFLRSEADERSLRAAREAERRAQADEIRAMHDAADAIRLQAAIQGSTAAAGGVAQCVASLRQVSNAEPCKLTSTKEERLAFATCKYKNEGLGKAGGALASVGEAGGQLLGGVQETRADTHAAQARHAAESADSRAEAAAQHRQRVERHTDSVLELVEGTLDAEHQGNLAILANF